MREARQGGTRGRTRLVATTALALGRLCLSAASRAAAPVAKADSATTPYQTAIDIRVFANDSDPDGDTHRHAADR